MSKAPLKGQATETVTIKRRGKVIQSNTIEEPVQVYLAGVSDLKHPELAAKVMVSGGLTKKIIEYDYMRIDVAVTLPAVPTEEGLDLSYLESKNYVANRLQELVKEIEQLYA